MSTAVDTTISSSEDMQASRIVYSPEKHSSRTLHHLDYMLPTEMSSVFPNLGEDVESSNNRAHIATRAAVLCVLFLCFWSFGSNPTRTFRKPGFCV